MGNIYLSNPLNLGNLPPSFGMAEIQSIKNIKLCETKPISETAKMSLTDYKIMTYDNNSRPSTMQKQSQTNPIKANSNPIFTPKKSKQTQSNPISIAWGIADKHS